MGMAAGGIGRHRVAVTCADCGGSGLSNAQGQSRGVVDGCPALSRVQAHAATSCNSLRLDSDRLRLALLAKARKSKALRCRSGDAMGDTMPTMPTYGTYGERLTYTGRPSCTATPCARFKRRGARRQRWACSRGC